MLFDMCLSPTGRAELAFRSVRPLAGGEGMIRKLATVSRTQFVQGFILGTMLAGAAAVRAQQDPAAQTSSQQPQKQQPPQTEPEPQSQPQDQSSSPQPNGQQPSSQQPFSTWRA